ncbi:hypothetical protein GOBAR_AA32970 [Gossypium barbadense]|uniref:Transposase MuDR plant domain-containing protein n=1 Tax=Gossypium barbadense TaxID=3634 RepID=A0A2P5W9G2_GOSBA|nr:hypothetical protein GOBAR_AA32970 [Gossypium barbadense]
MELEDNDDLVTMIAIYCPPKIKNLSLVELFVEIAESDPSQVVILTHCDPNNDFSDPDLDDIPEDIDEEGAVECENVNPHSVGNMGPGIVIRNNLVSFMTDVDPDAALAREFPEYTNILPAYLLNDESDNKELFVGQQFNNKKDCVHTIKQLSLKLGVDYKIQMWMIRKLEGPCTCTFAHMSQDHGKLDAKTICNCIIHLVKESPPIQVLVLIVDMQTRFKYKV